VILVKPSINVIKSQCHAGEVEKITDFSIRKMPRKLNKY
jgi:hypothetical protein